LFLDQLILKIKIKKQTPERNASGRWEIKIEGLPAGATAGTLNYVDISKTHADNEMPFNYQFSAGARFTYGNSNT
jgi:lysozyme